MRWPWLVLMIAGCGRVGFAPIAGDAGVLEPPPLYVSGTRLRAIELTTETGVVGQLTGWFDTELQIECRYELASDGSWRCLPDDAHAEVFADAACMQRLAVVQPPATLMECPQEARFARTTEPPIELFPILAPYTGPTFRIGASGCESTMIPTLSTLWEIGEASPLTMFAPAEVVVEPFTRLSHVSWVSADGSRELAPWLVDTATDETCTLDELEPNRAWCLPDAVGYAQNVWLDPTCTVPGLRSLDARPRMITKAPSVCANHAQLYERGAEHVGAFYLGQTDACVEGLPDAGWRMFARGAERELDEFVELALRVVDGPDRLRPVLWQTADGVRARDAAPLWDVALGGRCWPAADAATDRFTCAPPWYPDVGIFVYSEPTCTTVLASVRASCRDGSGAIWYGGADGFPVGCDGIRWDLHAFDVPVTEPVWELMPDGTCAQVEPGVTVRRSDGAMDASTLSVVRNVRR